MINNTNLAFVFIVKNNYCYRLMPSKTVVKCCIKISNNAVIEQYYEMWKTSGWI